MRSFGRFLLQIAKQYVSLSTGGIIVLLLLLYERWTGASVTWSTYLVIAGFTLFSAVFLAWSDENKARLTAEAALDERERRGEARKVLAALMGDGQKMLDGYDRSIRPTKDDVTNWADRTETKLRQYLDESYVVRFRDQSRDDGLVRQGSPEESRTWSYLRLRLQNLGQIVTELK